MARRLYDDRRWRSARALFLRRHPLCAMHERLGEPVTASVVDHVVPHKGDRGLFWDRANWQGLCAPCHNSTKQSQDRTGALRGAGADGMPLDPAHPWNRRAAS